jgi:hypothetical protein
MYSVGMASSSERTDRASEPFAEANEPEGQREEENGECEIRGVHGG